MARPRKQTVDYFPHDTDASHRKTLTVLQNKYGNDGYAFWYHLLEILGRSPGHFYNFSDPADWEFLIAETHISDPETAKDILNTLAILRAIDPKLHEQSIIWSQNFVDRLEDVYNKREEHKPDKPISGAEMPVSVTETIVSDVGNAQIKVNETKLNNKEENTPSLSNLSPSKEDVIEVYRENFGEPSEDMENELKLACIKFSPTWVIDAIKEAVKRGKKDWRYIARILENWRKFGKNTKSKQNPDKYIRGKYGSSVRR